MKQIGAEQLFRTDKESSISVPGSEPILWGHSYEIVCVQGEKSEISKIRFVITKESPPWILTICKGIISQVDMTLTSSRYTT